MIHLTVHLLAVALFAEVFEDFLEGAFFFVIVFFGLATAFDFVRSFDAEVEDFGSFFDLGLVFVEDVELFFTGFFAGAFFLIGGFFAAAVAFGVSLYDAFILRTVSFSSMRFKVSFTCVRILSAGMSDRWMLMYLVIACKLEPDVSFRASNASITRTW